MERDRHHDGDLVLVLGGTGGIGSAVCRRLLAEGAQVISASRSDPCETSISESSRSDGLSHLKIDAADFDQMDEAVEAILSERGPIRGLVNAVGSILLRPAHLTDRATWEDVIRTNLTSAFAAVRSGAKAMRASGGSIVLIASAAASIGLRNHEAIAAAKGGVVALTRSAAATYARFNLRVNCVSPGMVLTSLSEPILASEKARAASEALHPLRRLGTPDEIASAVCWLLRPEQSWVTGQVLGVDGGLASIRDP